MISKYLKYLPLFLLCLKVYGQNTPKTDRTFYDDKFIHIDSIVKSEYDKIPASDQLFDIDTTKRIKARHDSLTFPIENGSTVILINDLISDFSLQNNSFIGQYKSLPYYIVETAYWEIEEFRLINKNNGRQYVTYLYPLLSPAKKLLIGSNPTLGQPDLGLNGIQLFEINKNELKTIFQIELEKFQIDEMRWISESKVAVKIGFMKPQVGIMKPGEKYGILTIKK